jgi:hypothetical protein
MSHHQSTIAPEIIACIAEGRNPTIYELSRLADRIASEAWGTDSAFSWGALTNDASLRLISLRFAQAALSGHGEDGHSSVPASA